MAQRTTITPEPEIEESGVATTPVCRHHWVIQPADGPVSNGSCQVCGETREFKNYVESATWGDSRTASKNSSASAGSESTSDDDDASGQNTDDDESGPDTSAANEEESEG